MNTKTLAVQFVREGIVEVAEVDLPPPAAGEVQVATEFSMISSGTEFWGLKNEFTWQPTPFPCVPGYQRVGRITGLGDGVAGLEVGQRVMATVSPWPGPVHSFWGSHAAAANTPAGEIIVLPEEVSSIDASGLVVAQVGFNAASRLVLEQGEWVLVYGDGMIGQCASQAARARGARTILVGHRKERLELAARFSADRVMDPRAEDLASFVEKATEGKGVGMVIDTVQTESSQSEYVPLITGRSPGQIVYSGFTPGKAWADMGLLQQRELTCHFVSGWNRERMLRTLSLMAEGRMRLEPLVTRRESGRNAHKLYEIIDKKSEPFLGLLIDWRKS